MRKLNLLTILFLLSLTSISFAQKKQFSLQDVVANPKFFGKSLRNVQWFDDGNKFSFIKFDTTSSSMAIFEHDVTSGNEKIVVTGNDLKLEEDGPAFRFRYYTWSPNNKYLLFATYLMPRYSKPGGDFYVYNIEDKSLQVIHEGKEKQWVPEISPDSKNIAFVRGNNIFVYNLDSEDEAQLTFDGSGTIINGQFDWVYQEEFDVRQGYKWSPDSKDIAYWRLNQSKEPEIKIAEWDSLYFNFLDLRYPKAGAHNAIVKIGVVDINSKKTNWLDLGKDEDIYISRIEFTNDANVLSVQRLNRLQNHLELLFYDVNSGKQKTIIDEKSDAWIDIHDDLRFLKQSNQFIWSSERDGFLHLYLFNNNGRIANQITKGKWEVKKLISVNESLGEVFFTADKRGTIYTDFYSVNFDGSGLKRLTDKAGTYSVNMPDNSNYFVSTYRSSNSPSVVNLYKANGVEIKNLITNDFSAFADYEMPVKKFLTFKTTDGVVLNAFMIKPPDFDMNKKYPVLFYNYSGPGSQIVTDSRRNLWHFMLAQKGYIIFGLDNRGTGGRGTAFKHLVYKNLGHWEVNDLVEGAKYLRNLSFIDSTRIGIWGWSYGGYTSALTLSEAPEYFKMAVSVAPVTDWKFYDDIYTERYMSLPKLNPDGYKSSSVLEHAGNLKGKFLLIHGTADDNVHFQNSVELVNALIANNIQFQTMYYPGRNHSIYGGNTRMHLFTLITNFILKNL